MTAELEFLEVDSQVLGFDIWNLKGAATVEEFKSVIDRLSSSNRRFYVSSKFPIHEISAINAAEQAGFEFVETQFRTSLRLRKTYDVTRHPYEYVRVKSEDQLNEVLSIAATTIEHDRFSRDPRIGAQLSGERYKQFLRDSYHNSRDEIWCVASKSTGQILTFRSHRILDENEVLLLLGGVHPEHKDVGLGVISSYFCFNQLKSSGFKLARTHISAANIPIVNLEVGNFDFRVTDTFVILRRVQETY